MNARKYRIDFTSSEVDFPPIMGLGQSSLFHLTDSIFIDGNNIVLTITFRFIITDVYNNKDHEIINSKSVYQIPMNDIYTKDDIYDFYKDALLGLKESYLSAQEEISELPNLSFNTPPIEQFEREIGSVFYSLNYRN